MSRPPPCGSSSSAARGASGAWLCAVPILMLVAIWRGEAFLGNVLRPSSQNRSPCFAGPGGFRRQLLAQRAPKVACSNTGLPQADAPVLRTRRRGMTLRQWIRYLTSIHGISGAVSVLTGSLWTTFRLAMGNREASPSEVVANVVLSTLILITGISRVRTIRNQDLVLKFWVGISIQIFALVQILEAPLLGWIPYSIFGNWISRIWGVISVYFYVKWLVQIKKWNDAYATGSNKMVARIFHPLMAPAMGSIVVMEVVTFVNFVELHFDMVSKCAAARALFLDSQLVSLAVNNVAQFTLTLANQKKVSTITPLFYFLGVVGGVQFSLLMWVHLKHLGLAGLNAVTLIPLMCQRA